MPIPLRSTPLALLLSAGGPLAAAEEPDMPFTEMTPEQIRAITVSVMRGFVQMLHRRGLAPATIGRRIHCLRSFWNYLLDFGHVERDPCRRINVPKRERRLPVVLSVEECRLLLEVTRSGGYAFCRTLLDDLRSCWAPPLRRSPRRGVAAV